MSWYVLDINPEPWAVGPLGVGRKNGKVYPYVGPNQQLISYQQAVKEELESLDGRLYIKCDFELNFWFWRNIASHLTPSGRKASANYADTTNLQKATEDALQGVLFSNDRNCKSVSSEIVDQGPDVRGLVVILLRALPDGAPFEESVLADFPPPLKNKIDQIRKSPVSGRQLELPLYDQNPEEVF